LRIVKSSYIGFVIEILNMKLTFPYSIPKLHHQLIPLPDLNIVVRQNFSGITPLQDLKPLYMKGARIWIITTGIKNLFWAGNEFRNFDIKTCLPIDQCGKTCLLKKDNKNHDLPAQENSRAHIRYLTAQDLNGQF